MERRAHQRAARLLAGLALAVVVSGSAWAHATSVASAPQPAASSAGDPPSPPAGGPYLGAILDWSRDSPAEYRTRLRSSPAVFGYDAPLPMDDDEVTDLRRALTSAAEQGAGLLVTLLPEIPLSDLDAATVDDLVGDLSTAGVGGRTPVWVRPLPEMNAPWQEWGQQPAAFVDAYTAIATAVHAELDRTAMVWQPAYAAGYPFSQREGDPTLDAGPAAEHALDTDGDGRLTYRDDPYGPYWPGARAVDWVGLSLYPWGDSYPFGYNTSPDHGKLLEQLAGRYGYPDRAQSAQRDFYARFAQRADKPMVLETAALYSPGEAGVSETTVKRAWWTQLADPRVRSAYPGIGMVLWLELRRPEDEALGKVVDWRSTRTPALAAAFRTRLVQAAGLTTGPRGPATTGEEAAGDSASAAERPDRSRVEPEPASGGTVLRGEVAVWSSATTGVVALGALALGVSRRGRTWGYDADVRRDLRLDLLRGVAICFVVIDHIDIPSLWQLLTQEAIGPVSGAELFVLLSGVALGTVYGPRVTSREQWYDAATRLWRRAFLLWATALAVIVLVYLVAVLPAVDARVVTTFTDEGTGALGPEGRGRVYDLYAGFSSLADYPVPGSTLRDLLLLRMGPSQINIIGLYVVLLLAAPAMTLLLWRRWWAVLLAGSIGLYVASLLRPVRLLPSQFEDPFPLLTWQVLFVLGLIAGWHRDSLLAAARRPAGRALVLGTMAVTVALMLFSWGNPYLSNSYDVRLALLPDSAYSAVYDDWFGRTQVRPGRLLAAICVTVTGYALLTRFWSPVDRLLGRVLLPLGQSTLYLFVMHVPLVVVVANLPALTSNVWLGTLTHTVVLALLWIMVRRRFLFAVVPR